MTKTKLRKRYGKLTVIAEQHVGGRRTAVVNCTCGQQKRVLVAALTSGRTKSCGAPGCKYGTRVIRESTKYVPRGTRSLSDAQLLKLWALTSGERPITVAAALRRMNLDVPKPTVYSLLRVVKRCGGIDAYLSKVNP